ncbi:MAG: Rrf2 family transcriptional regulator [bacterium]
MLGLTKATDYAILALGYLDEQPDEAVVSTKEIAEAYSIPAELLAKVLQRLSKQGLVRAHQGRGGGYSLSARIEAISVTEVVEAVEGPIAIAACLKEGGEELCEQYRHCTIKSPVEHIQELVVHLFGEISVANITTGAGLSPPRTNLTDIDVRT